MGSVVWKIVSFGRFHKRSPLQVYEAAHATTPILIGYSNAMYKLGWRYERGSESHRNLPEALRCYRKSARLGNFDAQVRLAAGDL